MKFQFKNLTVKPTLMEEIYVTGQKFRNRYKFKVGVSEEGAVQPLLIAHDWLHEILNIDPSHEGENLLRTVELHLYRPIEFQTDVQVPQHLYEKYKYVYKNQEKLMHVHNLLN